MFCYITDDNEKEEYLLYLLELPISFVGEPEATVKSVRASAPVEIKKTGPKYYRCTYVPPIPGAYLLDIKWNKRPLKCCPFKINVHNPVYPSRVDVTGDHLKGGGVVGKDLHINVDPRLAGTGMYFRFRI